MIRDSKAYPNVVGSRSWSTETGRCTNYKESPPERRLEAGELGAERAQSSSRGSIHTYDEHKPKSSEKNKMNTSLSENDRLTRAKNLKMKKAKRENLGSGKSSPKPKEEVEPQMVKQEVAMPENPIPATACYTMYIRSENARCKRLFKLILSDEKDNYSLLSNAIEQQEVVIDLLQKEREALRKRMLVKKESKVKTKKSRTLMDFESPSKVWRVKSRVDSRALAVGDYYYSNLDEIFQTWIHLFSFIINLRINLINVVNVGKKDWFKPSVIKEKEIIKGAIECVKLYSRLKTKWLSQYFEELRCVEGSKSTTHITNYEERTSSPFLQELQFMVNKGKEMVEQMKIRERDRRMTAGISQ